MIDIKNSETYQIHLYYILNKNPSGLVVYLVDYNVSEIIGSNPAAMIRNVLHNSSCKTALSKKQ